MTINICMSFALIILGKMPIGTYTPPLWKTITQKKNSIFFILFFHFRCILLQISHKKCFFISISILGRSGVKYDIVFILNPLSHNFICTIVMSYL